MKNQTRTLKYLPILFVVLIITIFILNVIVYSKYQRIIFILIPIFGLVIWTICAFVYRKYYKIFIGKQGVKLNECDYKAFTDFSYKFGFYLVIIASTCLLILSLIFSGIYSLCALNDTTLVFNPYLHFWFLLVAYLLPVNLILGLLFVENWKNKQYSIQKRKELLEKLKD